MYIVEDLNVNTLEYSKNSQIKSCKFTTLSTVN